MELPKALTRSERRKARTVAAILDAAERHFLAHGYEDAKVDEIAAAADVGVGSIYNHFGSKEGLYAGLTDRALELHTLYMTEGADTEASPLEQLLDTGGRLARFGREHPGYLRAIAQPPKGLDPALAERVRTHLADLERRTAALVEAGVRKREIRPVGSRHAAAFLWSAWLGMLTLGPAAEAPDDAAFAAVVEAGLRIVVGGLATDASRESSELVRAILETTPSRAPAQERGQGLRREPVARDLLVALPGLALWTAPVECGVRKSPAALVRRLGRGSRPVGAAAATGLRGESTPWAYRIFLRQAGGDPDAPHPVIAELALGRDPEDPPASRALPEDALRVVAIETGVPIVALDADRLEGSLALRSAQAGERLGEGGPELAPGEVVIADLQRPLARVLGEVAADAAPGEATERLVLAALQVKGVPDVSAQEALWTAVELLRA